jgi:hypothetical protein
MNTELSDSEKALIALRYEQMMQILASRHGITERQIVETVEWVHRHREWLEAMKRGGSLGLIGFLLSAALLAIWEGVKAMVRRP